jgi:hypothetical protein
MKTLQTYETMRLLSGLTPAMIACIAGDKQLEQLVSSKGGTKASSLHKKSPGSKMRQHRFLLIFFVAWKLAASSRQRFCTKACA